MVLVVVGNDGHNPSNNILIWRNKAQLFREPAYTYRRLFCLTQELRRAWYHMKRAESEVDGMMVQSA